MCCCEHLLPKSGRNDVFKDKFGSNSGLKKLSVNHTNTELHGWSFITCLCFLKKKMIFIFLSLTWANLWLDP